MNTAKRVGIIDYKMGNLFSVHHACLFVGLEPTITSDRKMIKDFDALILPGVGAFGEAMQNLSNLDLIDPIRSFIRSGKPFLGVCLGMQLLFNQSEEFGIYKGLDIIPGNVTRFPNVNSQGSPVRVPQIGWNQIFPSQGNREDAWKHTPMDGIASGEFVYFVHSYFAVPALREDILTMTTYEGITYCSSIMHGNVIATQFHPEKSAHKGLIIYQNWANAI